MIDSRLYSQSALIDLVLETLRGGPALVGDGIAPPEGGWTSGTPGKDAFKAYTTVASTPSRPGSRATLNHSQDSWVATFRLTHVGGGRAQASWCADVMRAQLLTLTYQKLELGAGNLFSLNMIQFDPLGGVNRVDSNTGAYWEVVDGVSLALEG